MVSVTVVSATGNPVVYPFAGRQEWGGKTYSDITVPDTA